MLLASTNFTYHVRNSFPYTSHSTSSPFITPSPVYPNPSPLCPRLNTTVCVTQQAKPRPPPCCVISGFNAIRYQTILNTLLSYIPRKTPILSPVPIACWVSGPVLTIKTFNFVIRAGRYTSYLYYGFSNLHSFSDNVANPFCNCITICPVYDYSDSNPDSLSDIIAKTIVDTITLLLVYDYGFSSPNSLSDNVDKTIFDPITICSISPPALMYTKFSVYIKCIFALFEIFSLKGLLPPPENRISAQNSLILESLYIKKFAMPISAILPFLYTKLYRKSVISHSSIYMIYTQPNRKLCIFIIFVRFAPHPSLCSPCSSNPQYASLQVTFPPTLPTALSPQLTSQL